MYSYPTFFAGFKNNQITNQHHPQKWTGSANSTHFMKFNNNFTASPWHLEVDEDGTPDHLQAPDMGWIAQFWSKQETTHGDATIANAKLIQAAPLMAEAIIYWLEVLEDVNGGPGNYNPLDRPDHVMKKFKNALEVGGLIDVA